MKTAVSEPRSTASRSALKFAVDPWTVAIWLMATAIACFFALVDSDATLIEGAYLPRGNDSFYHARRILDATLGPRGFYQFDDRLQVPDGAWIPWPWAYDYLVAKALQFALWVDPLLDPMAFVSYVPVAWIAVNAALFIAATRALGISRPMQWLAALCFALSPLTQLLHVLGMIDHHYAEHTFVLLTAWLGLRWFGEPQNPSFAAPLAIALGMAPAFHTGLFVWQLVPLATLFVLWMRGSAPLSAGVFRFATALPLTAIAVALPADAFRQGLFEFGLLSWFHVYVAACTAAASAFMAWRPFSQRRLVEFAGLCIALALPLGAQLLSGAGFLSGEFSILGDIVEAQSPYRLFTAIFGARVTASYYSWLGLAAPLLLLYFAWRAVIERAPRALFFSLFAVFGLAFFLAQFRFHYYGFFALIAGLTLLVDECRTRLRWHAGVTATAALGAMVLAYQPALRERLFTIYAPAGDSEYASAVSIFFELRKQCAADPGTVLASADDGSAILFHTECSVIANNFILRSEDERHIQEIKRLMLLTPQQIQLERPDVRYLFVRVRDFSVLEGDTAYVVEDNAVAKALFLDPSPPPGFTLLQTVRRRIGDDSPSGIYARLYKIDRLPPAIAP